MIQLDNRMSLDALTQAIGNKTSLPNGKVVKDIYFLLLVSFVGDYGQYRACILHDDEDIMTMFSIFGKLSNLTCLEESNASNTNLNPRLGNPMLYTSVSETHFLYDIVSVLLYASASETVLLYNNALETLLLFINSQTFDATEDQPQPYLRTPAVKPTSSAQPDKLELTAKSDLPNKELGPFNEDKDKVLHNQPQEDDEE
ncbi:hypothetical protein JHK85_007074 [Glycine max]|nr:hypothetical protein JHK85_007074 [Glycine max]